jgi:type VI secretion system protein ImpM
VSGPPGYFGKVVTHGDFVMRRLPPDFVGRWDAWLQAGLRHSRGVLGDCWQATYLNSPLWRFVLGPGACGREAMAGVLAPGVDRVGRYFPLTLAAPATGEEAPLHNPYSCAVPWFDVLERVALATVAPDFSLAALDAALVALGGDGAPGAVGLAGGSVFWTDVTLSASPLARAFDGLPAPEDFCALLAGLP